MDANPVNVRDRLPVKLREFLDQNTALCSESAIFPTGIAELNRLFPLGGIPYGQLLELTGEISSGKTTVLMRLLAGIISKTPIAYFDIGNTLYFEAAMQAGIDHKRLSIMTISSAMSGLKTAEKLLEQGMYRCMVFDLVGEKNGLSFALVHRFRQKVVRAKGLAIFLTENNSHIIPASFTSLRLLTQWRDDRIEITVMRSRICPEGVSVEIPI